MQSLGGEGWGLIQGESLGVWLVFVSLVVLSATKSVVCRCVPGPYGVGVLLTASGRISQFCSCTLSTCPTPNVERAVWRDGVSAAGMAGVRGFAFVSCPLH